MTHGLLEPRPGEPPQTREHRWPFVGCPGSFGEAHYDGWPEARP